MNFAIQRLVLTNFMNHSHLDLDFSSSNAFLIIGPNGAGKSAVLDAIHMCLNPKFSRCKSPLAYIKAGTEQSTIELYAIYNGKPLKETVTLNIEYSKKRTLQYDGKELGSAATKQFLTDNGFVQMSDIMFSVQNDNNFSRLTSAQRASYIKALSNIDTSAYLDKIYSEIDLLKAKLTQEKADLSAKQKLAASYKETIKEFNAVKDSIKIDQTEESKLQIEQKDLQSNIAIATEKLKTYDSLQDQISRLNAETYKLRLSIADLKKLKTEQANNAVKLSSLKEKSDQLSNDIAKQQTSLNELQSKVDEQHQVSKQANELFIVAKTDLAASKSDLKAAESGYCPTCKRPFTIDELSSHQEAVKVAEDKLALAKEAYNKASTAFEKLQLEQQTALSKLLASKRELASVNAELAAIKQNDFIDNEAELQADLDAKSKRLADLQAQAASTIDMQLLANLQTKLSESTAALQKIAADKQRLSQAVDMVDKFTEKLKTEQTDIDNLSVQQMSTSNDIQIRQSAKTVFQYTLPRLMISKLCDLIMNSMNQLIHIVFPELTIMLVSDETGVDIKVAGRKAKTDNSDDVDMCSGFEKSIISIAFRLILAKLYDAPLLVLDEIDADASTENALKLFNFVLNFSANMQTIIISHKTADDIAAVSSNLQTIQL